MPTPFDILETPIAPGLSVIEASAGTGKTYAISRLVPRLLLEGTVSRLREILLVTFTNDAASELSSRVRGVLEKLHGVAEPDEKKSDPAVFALRQKFSKPEHREIIARALLDIDQLGVSTIHSFCQRILQTEGTLCGLPVMPELITDAKELIEDALYDLWNHRIAGDEFLTAIAASQDWTLGGDLEFVHLALELDDPEAVPPARRLEDVLKELREGVHQFTTEMIGELTQLAEKVDGWNKAAGDKTFRELQFSNLLKTDNFSAVLTAVNWLVQIASPTGGLIKTNKNNKPLIAEAANLDAVKLVEKLAALSAEFSWHWKNDCAQQIRQTVVSALRKNRQITYDGLITTLRNALRSANSGSRLATRLREQYRVALIDESQDTDPRQFEIFHSVFNPTENPSRLVLIGDPKQAIYEFRSADVNTYLEARRCAGDKVYSLSQTFRSPQSLVHAVNTLFERPGSLLKKGLEFSPASSGLTADTFLEEDGVSSDTRLEAWIVPDADAEKYSNKQKRLPLLAGIVASEIVRLLRTGTLIVDESKPTPKPVQPGDFAILVSDRFQAAAMMEELKARQVPAVQAKTGNILDSDEAAELLVILKAVEEPRRAGLRMAALATRLLGRTAADLRQIRDNADKDDDMLNQFLRWQTTLHRHGIAAALAEMDQDEKITLRLAGTRIGERRVTNLRQLSDLLQDASHSLGHRPEHLVRWFGQEIARAEGNDAEERQEQLESDAQAVQIVTMHSAKGLEYKLVFCPFLWSIKNPNYDKKIKKLSRTGQPPQLVNLDLADDKYQQVFIRAALEDRTRLAYVAITRAKVKVWVLGGALSGKGKTAASALDWLLRLDAEPAFDSWLGSTLETPRGKLHQDGLNNIIEKANGVIARKEMPAATDDVWIPSAASSPISLSALTSPTIPKPWGMTSFSSLTREKNPYGSGDAAPAPTSKEESNLFAAAPGGTMVGTAVHDWMERWNFSTPEAGSVEKHLAKYPLPRSGQDGAKPMHESVEGMLGELREAILPGLDCSISTACPHAESSEWHFQLPIQENLGAQALAAVFKKHGQPDYAAMLEVLPADQFNGYLHGFLDRLAFHNGIWGVIDWKTNKLAGGNGQDSLEACARQSHYLLQAHLYLVALRRFLGPEIATAGAWLIFLRGVRSGTSEGILHIQPSEALMKDLDALFAQPFANLCA